MGGGSGGAAGGGSDYLPCPTTAGTACAVLPLGDSITEGCCTAPEGGYRIELFRQAVTNGKNLTFVGSLLNGSTTVANRTFPMRHEGHGGYTISGGGNGGIAGTITDSAISTYHPNIVLLMIGTNDINDNIDVTNAPSRLGKLIDEITTDAPAALVVVSTIIPISAPGGDQRAQAYNAAIPGLVNARASAGKHVVLVDNYAAFTKDPNYQTTLKADGLHPNTAGYVILGQSFYGVISASLPAGP
jgi:lysophospholipase L1-like esterase